VTDLSRTAVRWHGRNTCLVFLDTGTGHGKGATSDVLCTFDDLVAWGEQNGLIDRDRAEELRIEAVALPKPAARTLALARNLREALRDVFIPGRPAAHIDVGLETLNAVASRLLPVIRLRRDGEAVVVEPNATLEDWLIVPLIISALDLAASVQP
jgi:Putative stress-induced transcription regulator